MKNSTDRTPVEAEVRVQNGRPMICLNGEPVFPLLYALTDVPGGRWSWEEIPQHNLQLFYGLGFRLFQLDLFLEHVWLPDGSLDLTLARKQIQGLLEVAPEAAVILRLHVNAPRWWRDRHPEEWTHFADVPVRREEEVGFHRIIEFDKEPVNRVSLASELWFEEASRVVRDFCVQLAATPEGGAVAGFQPACGVYGEWHYWGFFRNEPDTSAPMTAHFRSWLLERYGTERALRKAWNDPEVNFETATVPGMEERQRTDAGIFRHPGTQQRVVDYFRCQHELVADRIVGFCRTIKESWPRPVITGTFYGYLFSMFGRQAPGGHLELTRVLDSPWVDYLSGPQCYYPFSTEPGGAYRSRGLLETCRLHGKLWLDEMDQRPELRWDPLVPGYVGSQSTSVGTLRRNLVATFTRGHGLWLYDFGVGFENSGWWDHPALADEIRRLHQFFTARTAAPYRSGADVLLVYDTGVFYYLASAGQGDPLSRRILDETTLAFYLSGAVCDQVHRADLQRVDLGSYRAVVFANTFLLTPDERRFIREAVLRDGRHVVFLVAPGYTDGKSLNASFVEETSRFRLKQFRLHPPLRATVKANGWPRTDFGTFDEPVEPLFCVADPEAAPLVTLEDSGEVIFARKSLGNATSWFLSLPPTNPEPIRKLLDQAGAHIYGKPGDVFYAGGGLLCTHSRDGGKRVVRLKDGHQVQVSLPPAGTAVLDAQTGALLLS